MLNACAVSIANTMADELPTSDGGRVRDLLARLKSERGISQAEFARQNAFPGGPSMISQHIAGGRPISLEAAMVYAKGLRVTIDEVSPAAAELARAAVALLSSEPGPAAAPALKDALDVVLDAMAATPEREKLRVALDAFLADPDDAYRKRLLSLLSGEFPAATASLNLPLSAAA